MFACLPMDTLSNHWDPGQEAQEEEGEEDPLMSCSLGQGSLTCHLGWDRSSL